MSHTPLSREVMESEIFSALTYSTGADSLGIMLQSLWASVQLLFTGLVAWCYSFFMLYSTYIHSITVILYSVQYVHSSVVIRRGSSPSPHR
jgi:hypothetical protein